MLEVWSWETRSFGSTCAPGTQPRPWSLYEQLFGWDFGDAPLGNASGTMVGGEKPWATVVPNLGEHVGWFPYLQVEDLDAATKRAKELGASTLQAPVEGPAGTYTPIRDPGGAVFALF